MADESQSPEAEAALWVSSTIAGSIFGGVANELITSPILSALGITKSDNTVARYLQKVSQQLSALDQNLDVKMLGLQDSLSQIKSLSTEIKDYQSHQSLALALREFNKHARTIQSCFELFLHDAMAVKEAIASSGEGNNAITDLYTNILNAENAARVSEAMGGIYDLLVDPFDFDKGILDCVQDMITAEIEKYAETEENYRYFFKYSISPAITPGFQLPRDCRYYECGKIVVEGHNIGRAAVPAIAALFKRIVGIQMWGLVFLAKAWQEGPHARTLGVRTHEVIDGILLMKAFYPGYRTTVKDAIAGSLRKSGKYLNEDFLNHFSEVSRVSSLWSNEHDPGGFLNRDWLMMRLGEKTPDAQDPRFEYIYMVYQPWKDASELPAGADRYCVGHSVPVADKKPAFGGKAMPPNFPVHWDSTVFEDDRNFSSQTFDDEIYPGLNQMPHDPPEELASVLNGLPSSEHPAVTDDLLGMLNKSADQKMALAFQCAADDTDALWLQGDAVAGSVRVTNRRHADSGASTAWRVFFTQTTPSGVRMMNKMIIKCLGFRSGDREYLTGKTGVNMVQLADSQGADDSGGWTIVPVRNNVWLITNQGSFLKGNADGSVSLSPQSDSPSLQWRVYRHISDRGRL